MNNAETFLLVIIGVIILIILILFFAIIISKIIENDSVNNPVVVPSTCTVAINTVPDITSLDCCKIGGILTPFKYMGVINNVTYDMVVAPTPVPWEDVCVGFCTNGIIASTQQCSNGQGGTSSTDTANYNRCKLQLQPSNVACLGNPIAASGVNLFYGHSATSNECTPMNRVKC